MRAWPLKGERHCMAGSPLRWGGERGERASLRSPPPAFYFPLPSLSLQIYNPQPSLPVASSVSPKGRRKGGEGNGIKSPALAKKGG